MTFQPRIALGKFSLAAMLASLTACSSVNALLDQDTIDYRSTKTATVSRLEVPPDLTLPKVSDRYVGVVSATDYQASQAKVDTTLLPAPNNARIERIGSQRYLLVDLPADKVFPSLVEFWKELGFTLAVQSPSTGLIETDWAENRAKIHSSGIRSLLSKVFDSLYDSGERDMFRTRIEKNPQNPQQTEIYLVHRGTQEVAVGTARDPQGFVNKSRNASIDLENDMLRRMLLKFGVQEQRAKAIIAAGGNPAPKAKYLAGAQGGTLELVDNFETAYRATGLALDRNGFTLEDRNFTEGVYYVRYSRQVQDSEVSWWRRTFTSEKERREASSQFIVTVSRATPTQLTIKPRESSAASNDIIEKMLRVLLEELK